MKTLPLPSFHRFFLVCLLVGACWEKSHGNEDDPFAKWKTSSAGKKNQKWCKSNLSLITNKLERIDSRSVKIDSFIGFKSCLIIDGSIENTTNQKITSLIVDIKIINKEKSNIALTERVMLDFPIFRTETRNLDQPFTLYEGNSDLFEAMKRLSNWTCAFDLIAAIPEGSDKQSTEIAQFYRVKTCWTVIKPE